MERDNDSDPTSNVNQQQQCRGRKRKPSHAQPTKKRSQTRSTMHQFRTASKFSRVVVPETLQQISESDDIFEWNKESIRDVGVWKRRRPLPAMTTLATTTLPVSQQSTDKEAQQYERRGLQMPLLRTFLEKLREQNQTKDASQSATPCETNENQEVDSSSHEMLPMENPNLSTLTKGQHNRYAQLMSEKQSGKTWNQNKTKEFSRLSRSVRDEQRLYHETLYQYFEEHLNSFKVGFEAPKDQGSAFSCKVALLNSKQIKYYQTQWENKYGNTSNYYGKCIQTISIPSGKSMSGSRASNVSQLDSLILDNRIVHAFNATRLGSLSMDCFQIKGPTPLTELDIEAVSGKHWPSLLVNDTVAQGLAVEHNVDLVTCLETLHELIQTLPVVDHQASSNFMTPVSFQGKSVFMDLPIPQPCTNPRQSLSRGYELVLKHSLVSKESSEDHTTKMSGLHYVYSLLTVNLSTGPRPVQSKILIRSSVDLALTDSNTPVCLHAHLDYFGGQQEIFSSAEKATWILDKIVNPTCRVMVGRIVPHAATVNAYEDMTHAVVQHNDDGMDFISDEISPMEHIHALFQLLKSTLRLERGKDQILCWPGRHESSTTPSISVHKKETETGDGAVIDIGEELEGSSLVYTSSSALQQCARPFKWQHPSRIPFTFPVTEGAPAKRPHA